MWGAKGVAISYAVCVYLIILPSLYLSFKDTPVSVSNFFAAICKPMICSISMGVVCFLFLKNIIDFTEIVQVVTCFVVAVISYLTAYVIISKGTGELIGYFSYFKIAFLKK
jgi:hypothetical protein